MERTDRLVARLIAQPLKVKVRHYRGFPPELTSGEEFEGANAGRSAAGTSGAFSSKRCLIK
jgi:hypothetical protein